MKHDHPYRLRWAGAIVLCLAVAVAGYWAVAGSYEPAAPTASGQVPAGLELGPPSAEPIEWAETYVYPPVRAKRIDVAALPPGGGPAAAPNKVPGRQPRMPISEERARQLREAAMNLPADPTIQTVHPPLRPQASVQFADGIDAGENPITLTPPDPEMAVGPRHALVSVNVSFAAYSKATAARLFLTDYETFFGDPDCTGVFDPNALYDEEHDRFVVGIDADGDRYCVAASTTGDPTGTWCAIDFATNIGGNFFDYPHAGIGDDAIYMGANMFGATFAEGRVWAIDKGALYDPTCSTPVSVTTKSTGFDSTPQPMNLHGYAQGTWPAASVPEFILTDDVFDGVTMGVWSWDDPFGIDVFGKDGTIAWPGGGQGFPIAAPTAGGRTLTTNDWRVQDAEWRNRSLWTVHNVACNPGGGVVNCQQWAEVDPFTLTAVQGGVFGGGTLHRIFGDVGVNHCEDMVLGYTATNASIRPTVALAGRRGSFPPGALSRDIRCKRGEVDYTSFEAQPYRWGDYSGGTNDPDGKDLWYFGEYSKETGVATKWATYICRVKLSCSTP